jgi:branched-chain amino acid transport system substrate-binding protein
VSAEGGGRRTARDRRWTSTWDRADDWKGTNMYRFETDGKPRARARRNHLLALLLALSIAAAACSPAEDTAAPEPGVDEPDVVGEEPEAAEGDPTEPEVVAEGCDPDDPVQVGAVYSLTGPSADIGARAEEGTRMAEEELNAGDGILGRCVEVLLRDDEGDPTRASQVTRELVDQEGVDFVVGPFLSSPAGASIEATNQAGMLHIQGSVLFEAGDAEQFPYVFRIGVPAQLQAQTFSVFMDEGGYASAGVIAVNNALGIAVSEAFEASAEEAGLEVTTVQFHESGDTDHTPQLQSIQQTQPDVLVVMNVAPPDMIASIRARNGLGWDVPVLGFSAMAFAEVTEAIGDDGMDDVFAGQAFRNLSRDADGNVLGGERVESFLDEYREFVGVDEIRVGPQQVAAAIDKIQMVAWAADAVGSLDPDAIKDHLEANPYDGLLATFVYDEQRHDGPTLDDLVFVIARSLEDGTYELAPGQE